MRAAWYETQGPAGEVLKLGTMADFVPGPGEVRMRIAASGINPGDIKKRQEPSDMAGRACSLLKCADPPLEVMTTIASDRSSRLPAQSLTPGYAACCSASSASDVANSSRAWVASASVPCATSKYLPARIAPSYASTLFLGMPRL
jgi:hypothetical protein